MPTYEYHCGACDATVDIFQPIKSSPKRTCPECGARKLKRQIGAGAGILFKGSGFYETDYRSDSYKKAASKEKESTSSSSDSNTSSDKSASKKKGAKEGSSKPKSNKKADSVS